MASGFGRMIAPSRSVYGVTKWAVEGFSDCLRYEMRHWGVKVRCFERKINFCYYCPHTPNSRGKGRGANAKCIALKLCFD